MKRIYSIDFLKFFAAFGVVLIHTNPFEQVSLGSWNGETVNQALIGAARFAVPFFFIVSGYFFGKKVKQGRMNSLELRRQIIGLFRLYISWTFFYLLYDLFLLFLESLHKKVAVWPAFQSYFQENWTFSNFFYYGNPTGARHLWYLTALIWSLLIISFFLYYRRSKLLLMGSLILNLIGIFDLTNQFHTRETLFLGLFYTTSGVFIAFYEKKWIDRIPLKWFLGLIPTLLMTQILESIFLFKGDYFLSTIPLTWLLLLLALQYKKLGKDSWITWIGADSVSIYLLHWFYLKLILQGLDYFGWNQIMESLMWALLFPVFLVFLSFYTPFWFRVLKEKRLHRKESDD